MSEQLDINCDSLIEIAPSEWCILLNLYANKKTESSGYPLISNYIKWQGKEPDLDIQCLSLNGDWQTDGTFLMIVGNGSQRKMVFFNTLSESLERLTKALLCVPSGAVEYLLHDYSQRLVPAVDAYIRKCANRQLQTTQTAWYKASKELVATFSTEPPAGIQLRSLNTADAAIVNGNWPYGSKDSVQFVKRLIEYNVSIGAYDAYGKLLAWCLRLPIGALGLLQVMDSHRRLGLGSLMVRVLSSKISELGDEVLAPVVTENTPSRRLFEKLGFQKIDNVYWTG